MFAATFGLVPNRRNRFGALEPEPDPRKQKRRSGSPRIRRNRFGALESPAAETNLLRPAGTRPLDAYPFFRCFLAHQTYLRYWAQGPTSLRRRRNISNTFAKAPHQRRFASATFGLASSDVRAHFSDVRARPESSQQVWCASSATRPSHAKATFGLVPNSSQ